MNLFIIKDIILNLILITFPILVYLVLVCYRENINNSNKDTLLTIALITSLYLCLKYIPSEVNTKVLLFCNIPIVIAYMKKKHYLGIFLSIANVLYSYYVLNIEVIIMIIKYLSYLVLYLCARKKNLSSGSFILSIAIIQGFFLSFEYFFKDIKVSVNDFILLLIIVFIYYFTTFSILYLFKVMDKIESLNTTIKMLEKDKKIKDALFKLTHEIKNPLAVCKGYMDMIDLNKEEKALKYISIMKQEINRSLNIISDFVEYNKIKVVKEQIDLNCLLDDVYDSFKILMTNKKIKLEYKNRDDQEIYFNGDYERLKQVIINMLKNAYEACTENGKVEISSNLYKNYLDILIEDNGIGMDEETLKNIKEMFYTTKQNGTGLGVALSNEIIKSHNGELLFTSEPNKGTKVTIRLPY